MSKSAILKSVKEDPATEPASHQGAAKRRRQVIAAGHAGRPEVARRGLDDPDPATQAAAVGALARIGVLTVADIAQFLDPSASVEVRRRAADAALTIRGPGSRSTLYRLLIAALDDPDPLVVVNACWFVAERRVGGAVTTLSAVATDHEDVRCREAAVAALGAVGDPAGLPAVLAGLDDKPTIRRRATVALAGFDDPRVEPALQRSAEDRDWQVRQAADELIRPE